jgi:cytochrome c-type biogenesis protein CcmF
MSMVGTFLVRSGILTSVHAFAVDPERGSFILALLAIYIGGALLLFGLRASSISEGERFSILSREGALVVNNVMLSAILAIVLLGTLYPLLTEAFDVRVSVGPPYFNPVGAIFFFPMLLVLLVGPLLRWRKDEFARVRLPVVIAGAATLGVLVIAAVVADIPILALLGLALAAGVGIASFMPLRGRRITRVPLATWGMVVAHFGVAVALFGMACETAFSDETLAAVAVSETAEVGPWSIRLENVSPIAGPNWTALEGQMMASYQGGPEREIDPQNRNFWAPPQETTESALITRWNGQLYAVIGNEAGQGRWQLRLWWKPFVTFIWFGGMLIALGGLLALVGRVLGDIKRRTVKDRAAERREEALA